MNKILKSEELETVINNIKDKNGKIILTNGCFDILHIGHARYLKEAKKLGGYLFIGINSDASVKLLKGESRPINNENDRAELMSYFEFVDYVTIFSEKTADNLILNVQPDIYVKGGDYNKESLPESDTIDQINAEVTFIKLIKGYSTTKSIERF
ncbi:MAG: adenylyltransferase/cytidyltransferase family protein [Candidatus Sericytochromatia bacterium]|nr:adenylyltransferase/cytidyltransferase family protein [Candidatus Sericytochromatia bacterium]